LIRKCEIVARSADGRRAICMDKENKAEILAYINRSDRHKKNGGTLFKSYWKGTGTRNYMTKKKLMTSAGVLLQ
jgi:hypothetical protein